MVGDVLVELAAGDELGDQVDGLRHAGHNRRVEPEEVVVVLESIAPTAPYDAHISLDYVHATHARTAAVELP